MRQIRFPSSGVGFSRFGFREPFKPLFWVFFDFRKKSVSGPERCARVGFPPFGSVLAEFGLWELGSARFWVFFEFRENCSFPKGIFRRTAGFCTKNLDLLANPIMDDCMGSGLRNAARIATVALSTTGLRNACMITECTGLRNVRITECGLSLLP